MKEKIKSLLYRLGIYNLVRKIVIKIYYPYKSYQIRKEAQEILTRVRSVLEEHSEDYWLDYGTLLGFAREGKIIKGDLDLDFGTMVSLGKDMKDFFEKEQIFLVQRTLVDGTITMEQYRYKNIDFDIFYYRKVGSKFITNVWLANNYDQPQKVSYTEGKGVLGETTFSSFTTKDIFFYDVPFKIPENYEFYLYEHFGEDFMIPNPNFTHDDEINKVAVKKDFEVIFYE